MEDVKKILVVEDEPVASMVIQWTLSDMGHQVLAVRKGREAIEKGIPFKPDIIIADWNLEDDLDGSDVCRFLLDTYPSIKIIMISGSPEEHVRSTYRGIAPDCFIAKPCTPDGLASAVRECVKNIESVRQTR